MKHTPGSWKTKQMQSINGFKWWLIQTPDNITIKAVKASQLTKERAEFIVRACNAHYALFYASKDTIYIITSYQHIPQQFKAFKILHAALSQAEGREG